jgi:hypothetical protein
LRGIDSLIELVDLPRCLSVRDAYPENLVLFFPDLKVPCSLQVVGRKCSIWNRASVLVCLACVCESVFQSGSGLHVQFPYHILVCFGAFIDIYYLIVPGSPIFFLPDFNFYILLTVFS